MKQHPIPKRLGALLICFALLVGMLPVTAGAADNTYNVGESGVYITQNGSYYITGNSTTNPITVGNGQDPVPVTITLSNVTIDLSEHGGTAFDIQSTLGTGSNVTLNLMGTNTLISGTDDDFGHGLPGIRLPQGASLTIQGSGSLTVTGGSGSSTGSGGAGIGGNSRENCGTLTITGGTVTATGGSSSSTGDGGAGIGGGESGAGGSVTIIGGTVTATGGSGGNMGDGGAGIGGGGRGAGGNVTIAGGSVTATGGSGYNGGVGIGGGTGGGAGGNVTITGGAVTVTGGAATEVAGGAGIGSGVNRDSEKSGTGSDVTITGGNVTITGGYGPAAGGAGIGGGANPFGGKGSDAGTVIILSPVTVRGGTGGYQNGADIGGGQTSSSTGSAGGNGQGIRPGADGTYEAYGGSFALPDGLVIPGGATVTIPKDIVLTVPEDTTLTNNGTITGAGGLTVAGDVTGSGSQSLTGTVTKKDQADSPDAPTRQNVGSMSVTLGTQSGGVAGVEYACVQGASAAAPTEDSAWQTSPYFNDLSRATTYTFFARYKGNGFYNPSKASAGLNVTTVNGAPTVADVVKINYQNETITFDDSKLEMNTSSSFDGTYIVNGASISEYIPSPPQRYTTLSIRWKAADGMPASENGYVSIPARPETPSQAIDNATEQIAIAAGQEYQIGSADTWTAVATATNVTVAPGAAISIRVAATDSAFKSETHTVTAPERADPPAGVTINYATEILSGTTTGMEWGVAPSGQSAPSQWKGCSADMSLEDIDWTGSEMTVYFRTAATDDSYASNPVFLTIPARPAAPAVPSVDDKTDTTITITAETDVEYQLGDSGSWVTDTDGDGSITFDNLPAGTAYTLYARYPAVTGDTPAFASAEATLQVTTKTSAGVAPTVGDATVTDTTITLPYDAAWEYSKDGTNWNNGTGANVFTGLTAATEYTFYVRVAETTTAEASATATVGVYTAHASPTEGNYTIDFGGETLTFDSDYEVNTAEDFTGTNISDGSITSYIGRTLYIRRAATLGGAPASASVAIPLTRRPAAPAVQGVNETVQGREDGKITGLTAGVDYEISDDSGQSWEDAELTGTEITGLAPGDYQVRAKSTDTSFTGEAASVTISTGAEPTYTLNVTAPAFDSVYTGYAQPEAKAITISSAGNSDATISSVTVDNASFVIGGSGSTVPAGGSITTWTIRPAAGLSVGTYTATITVTYDGGATATAQVSFTVTRRPSSGGGGTTPSNPTYTPGVTEPENGAVTVTPEKPKAGDTVTITATPEERYKVDSVTVTGEDGNPVAVTAREDGSFTFTQPEGDVTITVTFDVDMPFTDVPEGAWYIEGAKYVYGNFIMSGTSPTTFSPSTPVSRGMIMQILYNMVGQPDVEGDSNFTDVDEDYWSADAIAWAVANGVAGGFGDGTFRPDEGLTREQMAVVLRNFAYQMGWDISASGDLSRFTDIPEDSWARDALAWAFAEGLLTGTSGTTMAPTGEASRAQIAVIMMRFCQRYIDNVE